MNTETHSAMAGCVSSFLAAFCRRGDPRASQQAPAGVAWSDLVRPRPGGVRRRPAALPPARQRLELGESPDASTGAPLTACSVVAAVIGPPSAQGVSGRLRAPRLAAAEHRGRARPTSMRLGVAQGAGAWAGAPGWLRVPVSTSGAAGRRTFDLSDPGFRRWDTPRGRPQGVGVWATPGHAKAPTPSGHGGCRYC